MQPPRFAWLDGLRGLGAVQVLLLHVFGAFQPELVRDPSPLWLLYDGETAVFIFFLLSGAVLTGAFASQTASPPAQMAARVARFALPAAASAGVAFALFRWLPDAHLRAAAALPGSWLAEHWTADGTAQSLATDIFINGLMLGYRGLSLMDAYLVPLMDTGAAYNAPLWTLSLELQGSVLVLLLTVARRRSPFVWLILTCGLALFLLRTPLVCFIVGHLAMLAPRSRKHGPIGVAMILLGCGLAFAATTGASAAFRVLADANLPLAPAFSAEMIQRGVAAMLILGGIGLSAPLQHCLSHPFVLWLGRLSFPLYLMHWPAIFGPGAWAFLTFSPALGQSGAAMLATSGAVGLSVVLARLFRPVDEAAIVLARRLRSLLGAPRQIGRSGIDRGSVASRFPWAVRAPVAFASPSPPPCRPHG